MEKIKGKLYLNNLNNKEQVLCIGQVQSGKTKHIIETTINALDNDLFDCVIILAGTNNTLLSQTRGRIKNENKLKRYKIINLSDGYNIDNFVLNKKYIIYGLKGDDALLKILKFCKQNKENRFLIIDDESDYGSLNISKNKNKSSKIYSIIKEIYEKVQSCKYLSVTATPFANLLNDSWNFEYVYYIEPAIGYCGIEFFNKENLYEIDDSLIFDCASINKKKFEQVLRDHIIRVRKSKLTKTQLLINFNLGNTPQEKLKNQIISFMPFMRKIINFGQTEGKDENNKLLEILQKNIYTLNDKTTDKEKRKMFKNHSIIIGGNMVSRGFTFKELITCIMVNEPESLYSADTLLQRCRWFGYRKKNEYSSFDQYKFMKIYITKKIYNSLIECERLNKIIINERDIDIIKQKIELENFIYIKPTNKIRRNNEKQ